MKITIGQLFEARGGFKEILDANPTLPPMLAYRASALIKKLNPELEAAAAVQCKLINLHGKTDGDKVIVAPENVAAFQAEMNEFLSSEIEVAADPLPLTILDHIKEVSLQAMQGIYPFLAE